jgi:hypothetical protein
MPSKNIEDLFEDLAIKLGIRNPYDAAEGTISRIRRHLRNSSIRWRVSRYY